jgi:uncharacterized protein
LPEVSYHSSEEDEMRFLRVLAVTLALLGLSRGVDAGESPASGIDWQPYSSAVFERAKAEKRFILLDVEAVWCHWCHVMHRETYTDPAVIKAIREHYIAVRVDQDARPDISIRYEDYGWPATVILAADGTEIVKRRGFVAPQVMASILVEVVKDPSPVPGIEIKLADAFTNQPALSKEARAKLEKSHQDLLDTEQGGLKMAYRYLPWEAVEYALGRIDSGDERERKWALATLDASHALLDPVFGGVYQYSVEKRWDRPHYEKIMSFQAENLRIHSLAYGKLRREMDLAAARNIIGYASEFLTSPEGAFYTSQDADVVPGQKSEAYFKLDRAARLQQGVPRVDKHRYARENGWMIEALATFYEATGDTDALSRARRAASWVLENRTLPNGGFRHDEKDIAGPYLGDSLAMGRACLALYRATAERRWLDCSRGALGFIEASFRRESAGYISAKGDGGPVQPIPQFEENIRLARFANLLSHYTGDAAQRVVAEHALRYLATEDVHGVEAEIAGVLIADQELATDPLHLTVVGGKQDPQASKLFAAASRETSGYKRIEWWDTNEGPLANPDVQYPPRKTAAAYVCSDRSCSAPLLQPADLERYLAKRRQPAQAKN